MSVTDPNADWKAFLAFTARRRSIRDFDGRAIDDGALREVLAEAIKAPSSGNLQPYVIHCVRDPDLKARVAKACNGQRAARSASALVVFEASPARARQTLRAQRDWLQRSEEIAPASRSYYLKQLGKFERLLRVAPLLGWLGAALGLLDGRRRLLPLGGAGLAHWATRSSLFAAQQLLLAATARGLDSCPMEGFDAAQVARALALPRGSVVPLVIAVGHRAADARLEPQWRRRMDEAVIMH